MFIMNFKSYSEQTDIVEIALDKANRYVEGHEERMTHEEAFSSIGVSIGM